MNHYLNLTNGLEWLPFVENPKFVRIESTAIEREDWTRVLRDLDADLLFRLACGEECIVYDCGAGREVSKVISVGVPRIATMLKGFWEGSLGDEYGRSQDGREMKCRIRYFRRYYVGAVNLSGRSMMTTRDGDKEFYRELAVGTKR